MLGLVLSMMKNSALSTILLVGAIAIISPAQAKSRAVRFSQAPDSVKQVIRAYISEELPGRELLRLKSEKAGGRRIYEAVIGGWRDRVELELDQSGRILETVRVIALEKTPAAIRQAAAKVALDGKIKTVAWQRNARRESYAITIVNRGGREHDVTVGPDGIVLDDADDDDRKGIGSKAAKKSKLAAAFDRH